MVRSPSGEYRFMGKKRNLSPAQTQALRPVDSKIKSTQDMKKELLKLQGKISPDVFETMKNWLDKELLELNQKRGQIIAYFRGKSPRRLSTVDRQVKGTYFSETSNKVTKNDCKL